MDELEEGLTLDAVIGITVHHTHHLPRLLSSASPVPSCVRPIWLTFPSLPMPLPLSCVPHLCVVSPCLCVIGPSAEGGGGGRAHLPAGRHYGPHGHGRQRRDRQGNTHVPSQRRTQALAHHSIDETGTHLTPPPLSSSFGTGDRASVWDPDGPRQGLGGARVPTHDPRTARRGPPLPTGTKSLRSHSSYIWTPHLPANSTPPLDLLLLPSCSGVGALLPR